MRILVYPTDINPYQSLLYGQISAYADAKVTYFEGEDSKRIYINHLIGIITFPFQLAYYKLNGYQIFHLHWIPFNLPSKRLFFRILSTLNVYISIFTLKLFNYKLIWTVHNILPHENLYLDDLNVTKYVSRMSSFKIIHSRSVLSDMKKYGLDPSNVRIIPHGNYISVYKNDITKEEARKYSHLRNKDFVFLFFGNVRPYKGVEDLITAFSKIQDKSIHLIIAGRCTDPTLTSFMEDCQKKDKYRIHVYNEYIDNDKIQNFFACADIVVLPFKEITTSGSALLSLSFGKSLICPRIGDLRDLPTNVGIFYNKNDKSGLYTSLVYSLKNKDMIKKLNRNSFNYAKTLSLDKIAYETYRLYRDALE